MPGYFVHIASAPEDIRSSVVGVKGLIVADLWKKHTPSKEEYVQFFKGCENAPTYDQILLMCSLEHGGTHFGSKPSETNNANFQLIKDLFDSGQFATTMFFKGYVHHLRVDHDFYADKSICNGEAFMADFKKEEESAVKALHLDWDKTNQALADWYPEVKKLVSDMPNEVKKVIGFATGDTQYVSLTPMHEFVEAMRQPKNLYQLLEG